MLTMSGVMFACGAGLGVVFATICLTASMLYDSYISDKKAVERRKAARKAEQKYITGERMKQLPEPKILYIEHKIS